MESPGGSYVERLQGQITWLKNELHGAHSTILDLIPQDMAELLRSCSRCESREEADRWRLDVIEAVVNRATLLPGGEGELVSRRRAFCPLCGAGSHHTGERGYAVPEGLQAHLEFRGNVQRCLVMAAAYELAVNNWSTRFGASDKAAEAAKMKKLAERRESETLYRVSPSDEPKLLEEDKPFDQPRPPRSAGLGGKQAGVAGLQARDRGQDPELGGRAR